MIKALLFSLLVTTPTGDTYELDSQLTANECMAALEEQAAARMVWIIPGREAVANAGLTFACSTTPAI